MTKNELGWHLFEQLNVDTAFQQVEQFDSDHSHRDATLTVRITRLVLGTVQMGCVRVEWTGCSSQLI